MIDICAGCGEHRRNEERFDLAMRASNDGIWDLDLASNAVYYSPRWKSMLGYTDEEIEPWLGAFERLVHPSDLSQAMSATRAYLAGATDRYEMQLRMRHKAGHYVDILTRGFAARDEAGTPYRLVGTHIDISEQKRVERLLAAQAAATRVLATATTLMETLPRFLSAVGDAGLWSIGCVWAVDAGTGTLRCLALWHAADVPATSWADAVRRATIRKGTGVAGRAWDRGLALWVEDESIDCATPEATALGMRATFAVPVAFDGRTVGVVQFCAREVRPRDERWFRMFDQLHTLAVQIVARRRSESAARRAA
jgi:PAS domain S-box-containing protein